MSEAAAPLGERLKAERERKGFSVQKAADDLHLDAWVIEALESGDYARIGPSVYGKGHLKHYAGLLGLPTDDVLGAYDTRSSPPVPAAQAAVNLRMRAGTSAAGQLLWTSIAGGLTAALVIAGLFWWHPWRPRAVSITKATAVLAAPASSAGAGADRSAGPAAAAERSPGDGASAAEASEAAISTAAVAVAANGDEPVAGVGRARLRLSFSADSWVDIHDAAGRRLYAGNGHANSVRSIAGAAPMRVYLGFASGVQLEVNNHVVAIGPQFVAGDVARFEAGADGVLRRDAHATPAAANPHPRG